MMSFLAAAMVAVATSLTSYVQPFVGTTNFGACNPGAVVPSGMMSVSPFNVMGSELNVWDKDSRWWSTPYVYENKYFTGFSHVNLSGVGCPDVGALLTMPTTGSLQVDYHAYGSEYANEAPEPGYYGLDLTAYGVKAEATTTLRSSVERYTFPAGQANILPLQVVKADEHTVTVEPAKGHPFTTRKGAGFSGTPDAGTPANLVIRPENIDVLAASSEGIPAKVVSAIFVGSHIEYELSIEGRDKVVKASVPSKPEETVWDEGEAVKLHFDNEAALVVAS